MKRNQSAEDYLETILLLSGELKDVHKIDVARKMSVSQPAVLKAVNLLLEQGYIIYDGLHICLTERGKTYAENVYHRHCVLREFLIKLGVNRNDADIDACEMEHIVSPATFEAIEKFLSESGGNI